MNSISWIFSWILPLTKTQKELRTRRNAINKARWAMKKVEKNGGLQVKVSNLDKIKYLIPATAASSPTPKPVFDYSQYKIT